MPSQVPSIIAAGAPGTRVDPGTLETENLSPTLSVGSRLGGSPTKPPSWGAESSQRPHNREESRGPGGRQLRKDQVIGATLFVHRAHGYTQIPGSPGTTWGPNTREPECTGRDTGALCARDRDIPVCT